MESTAQSNTKLFNTDFCLLLANQVLLKEATKGSNFVASPLSLHVILSTKGSNFVASPLSLHVILSLIASGSKGKTLEELLQFLRSTSVSDLNLLSSEIIKLTSSVNHENNQTGPLLSFVNGIWLEKRFNLKPSFEETVKVSYKAQLQNVDFVNKANEVLQEVNAWTEEATKGLIKELLPPGSLSSDTALVLANALYFKGAWDRKFDPSKTKPKEFHLLNGHTIHVPFMKTENYVEHFYGHFDGYKVLEIPYQRGKTTQDSRKFSMYFLLPNEKNGLPNLVQKLNSEPSFFNQPLYLRSQKLSDFWIPKFKFSFQFEASKTMQEMGLKLPFMNGELTEMIDDSESGNKLYVSNIFHKSFVEVNEEGTEAAASTTAVMRLCALPNPPPSFVADHPFLFVIREQTQRIVFFIGAVINSSLNA